MTATAIPPAATLTRRMLRFYDSADASAVTAGRTWYEDAAQWCEHLALEHDYPVDVVAAVVAVLSPRASWSENLHDAQLMLETSRDPDAGEWPSLHAFGENVAKAAMILNGADPATVVRGPKVTAFWRALLRDPASVTVDSWMARAAGIGRDVPTVRQHRAIYAAVERAAARRGESPAAMQAIVWVAVRGSAN